MHQLTSLLFAFSLMLTSNPAVTYGEPQSVFDESSGYGPVFEEQPVDTIYPEESQEDQIIMSCRARASPPATYKWMRNKKEIEFHEGSNDHYRLVGGNLLINNPDKSNHTGNYSCLATNKYGTIISQEASVLFGYLDMFSTEERVAVQVKEGQGVVLLCAPPLHFPDDLTIRWMLNEFPIFVPLDDRRFVSQTTGNLYIAKVDATDSGNYSCFVSSPSIAKSVFSKFIPLIPLPHASERSNRKYAADINVKFPDTYALVGLNITLECFALGNPVPLIGWRKIDGALPAHHEISTAGNLLHIYNVQYEDEGMYECEVINSKGKDWHKAHLYVEAAPQWVEHISSSERDIGIDYTMSCLASGKPKPHVYILRNGQKYGKHKLHFTNLTFDDSGMYQCIAENSHGVIHANAELRVFVGAPSFELNPVKKRLLGVKNGHVVIECKPKAAPKPVFSWSKGTELLSNTSRIFIWMDGSLEIRNITKLDEGTYTCFAENNRGKANSTGSLTVTEATKITLAPSNADVSMGEIARMQCAASHDLILDLTFIWSLNDQAIDIEEDGKYDQIVMDSQPGISSCELVIKDTQLHHVGHYTCMAQTPVDNVTASAELLVRGPPGAPGGVRVVDKGVRTVKLHWSHGSDNHSPISKYTVQYRGIKTMEDWKDAVTSPPIIEGNAETATVIDLIPWTEYDFRVIATNTLGTGEPSDPLHKINTLEAAPVVAPSGVGGGDGMSRELTITWTPVQPKYYYGNNFGYIIAFKPHDGIEWHKVTIADPQASRYIHKDPSIPPATRFNVKVKAFNSKGEGPFSNTADIYSAQDAPSEAPIIEEARALSATTAIVSWLPLTQQPVEGYQVRYWKKSMKNEVSKQSISSKDSQTRLDNLKPDTHYVIEVQAFNGPEFGPASQPREIHTEKAPPSRPPKIISTRLNPSGKMVRIAWEHVQSLANESTVENYKVLYKPEDQSTWKLYTTNKQYIELPRQKDGNYLVEVRAQSKGGDGAVAQVRISAGGVMVAQSLSLCVLLLVAVLSLAV
ncbi:contactin-1a [Trichomycterus rosablanca]|uniref:contactin-1a n=1 Tax=Trichomycterus rosablanca TaxID=2290929 RepID=UPI002F360006